MVHEGWAPRTGPLSSVQCSIVYMTPSNVVGLSDPLSPPPRLTTHLSVSSPPIPPNFVCLVLCKKKEVARTKRN